MSENELKIPIFGRPAVGDKLPLPNMDGLGEGREATELHDYHLKIKVTDRNRKLPEYDVGGEFNTSAKKKELGDKIRLHRQCYYDKQPKISDDEYDALKAELQGLIDADEHVSWVETIEADGFECEEQAALAATLQLHQTWPAARYKLEILECSLKAIQKPHLIIPD